MNNFRFYLKFGSLGQDFLYEITEPIGFDEFKLIEKQNTNRYSRDISYALELTFYNAWSLNQIANEQVNNPFGNSSTHLDMGLAWIFESNRQFGFENKIEFHLSNNNIFFYVGLLDCANPDTNDFDYFGCKIIQDNNVSDYKKHEDTVLDMFSNKNIKGNSITPATTSNVLKKGVSVFRNSKWNSAGAINFYFFTIYTIYDEAWIYFNNCSNVVKSDLKNSLSWVQTLVLEPGNYQDSQKNNFKVFQATKITTNLKINFTNFSCFQDFRIPEEGEGRAETRFVIRWGFDVNFPIGEIFILNYSLDEDETFSFPNQNLEYNIPFLAIGTIVWIYGESRILQTADFSFGTRYVTSNFNLSTYELEISATETAVDMVIPMVRYIDIMRQCSKNINNTPVIAPKFDVNGIFYKQFCFNRSLISGNKEKPFNTKFKHILGSVNEVNGDFEIDKDKIFVGQFDDFYENYENAVFQVIPSKEAKSMWNKRFTINIFKYLYKTFEQNRNSKNTSEAVHTSAEYTIPNEGVENKKEIVCELIRDPYAQQEIINLETGKPQTSDENDDKVYINDVVERIPSYLDGRFDGVLGLLNQNGRCKILNREIEKTEDESLFNWLSIGLEIGQPFYFSEIGDVSLQIYTIISITRTVLELNVVSPFADGNKPVQLRWNYQNVPYKSKTNEDFLEILGVSNPTTYQGLNFTIRRNLKYFESFLKTSCYYVKKGIIRNNYFKNSPKLQTRLSIESALLSENSDLIIENLAEPILTPKIFKLEVYASYLEYLQYFNSRKLNRGFVRCYWLDSRIIKGYVQDLEYNFRTASLELTIEQKHENKMLNINLINGNLFVNDVIYNLFGNANWFRMSDIYFQLFDNNNIAICNPYLFTDVKLNNQSFTDKNLLINQLNLLVL